MTATFSETRLPEHMEPQNQRSQYHISYQQQTNPGDACFSVRLGRSKVFLFFPQLLQEDTLMHSELLTAS